MKTMRRISLMALLLAMLALAVPASAASWRTYATARADGGRGPSVATTARNVEDIQLGIYTYDAGRNVGYEAYWSCPADRPPREQYGGVKTKPNRWTWVNLRASNTPTKVCSLSAGAVLDGASDGRYKISLRVR